MQIVCVLYSTNSILSYSSNLRSKPKIQSTHRLETMWSIKVIMFLVTKPKKCELPNKIRISLTVHWFEIKLVFSPFEYSLFVSCTSTYNHQVSTHTELDRKWTIDARIHRYKWTHMYACVVVHCMAIIVVNRMEKLFSRLIWVCCLFWFDCLAL